MRYTLLLLPLLVACAKSETPQNQTAAAPGPMGLTDADFAGTWVGTSMPEGSDSVVARFTEICGNGTCKGVLEGMPDTIVSTYTLSGDSAMGSAGPYDNPVVGTSVLESWTVHLRDGKVVGTGMVRLATNPDSVLLRYHLEGSRMQ